MPHYYHANHYVRNRRVEENVQFFRHKGVPPHFFLGLFVVVVLRCVSLALLAAGYMPTDSASVRCVSGIRLFTFTAPLARCHRHTGTFFVYILHFDLSIGADPVCSVP